MKYKLTESQIDLLVLEKEREYKEAQKIIKFLSQNLAKNSDSRIDFATKIFQLSTSSCPEARKFIKKVSMFCQFYGDDSMISEDEWRKLNNTEDLLEESTNKGIKKKRTLRRYQSER